MVLSIVISRVFGVQSRVGEDDSVGCGILACLTIEAGIIRDFLGCEGCRIGIHSESACPIRRKCGNVISHPWIILSMDVPMSSMETIYTRRAIILVLWNF